MIVILSIIIVVGFLLALAIVGARLEEKEKENNKKLK